MKKLLLLLFSMIFYFSCVSDTDEDLNISEENILQKDIESFDIELNK